MDNRSYQKFKESLKLDESRQTINNPSINLVKNSQSVGNELNRKSGVRESYAKIVDQESESEQSTEQQHQEATSSQISTLIKILKCSIGSGLIALPYAYYIVGIYGATFLLLIAAWMNFFSWKAMCDVINQYTLSNSQDQEISLFLLKNYGRDSKTLYICLVCTILLLFGSTVSYLIYINSVFSDTIPDLFDSIFYKLGYCIVIFIIISITSLQKQLESLRYITVVAILFTFIVIGFVIVYCIDGFVKNGKEQTVNLNIMNIPVAFGIILFTYDINGLVTEIRAEMKEPKQFNKILAIGLVIESFFYMFIGLIGYLTFGNQTDQIITTNIYQKIQNDSIIRFVFTGILYAYAASLFGSLLLNNIPALNTLKIFLSLLFKFDDTDKKNNIIINSIYILLQILVAFIFPKFSTLLSLIGCFCSVSLGFVIPFILYYYTFWNNISSYEKILREFVLFLGILGGVLGLVFNFVTI